MSTRAWVRSLTAVLVTAAAAMMPAAAGPAAAAEPAVPLTVGSNTLGQQGDSTSANRLLPGPVAGPPATAMASGRDHAYLLDVDRRVWGWGDNRYGQVGDGSTTVRRSPVLAVTDVIQIEAGHYHGIALRADGTVWTWGYGALGQLGLGTTTNRSQPTQVPGITDAVAVAGGRDMSYALRQDGTVLAWGDNTNGEIGDGTTTRRLTPVTVPGLTGVVELSAGRNHALARASDGSIWAWGDNAYGQVGDGSTTDRHTPVRVVTSGAIAVDAGAHHSVALVTGGSVLTWGRGYRGQLGLGNTASRSTPIAVPGLTGIVEIGDGRDQTFAVTAAGQVWAWGSNDAGQLGDGTTTTRTAPVLLALTGIRAVQSGSSHTVFLPGAGLSVNQPPIAALALTCAGLTCTADASGSRDPDGTITSFAVDFGDGAASDQQVSQHTYGAAGSYPTTVIVTDDDGATSTITRTVVVSDTPTPAAEYVASAVSNTNAANHRVTAPVTTLAGDQLVLAITVNTAGAVGEPSGLTGWSGLADVQGSDIRTRVWTRTALGPDAGRQVTVSLPATAKAALVLSVYRGVGPLTASAAAAVESVSRTQHTTPAIPIQLAGSRLVSLWSDKSAATTSMTPPAEGVQRILSTGSAGGRITMLLADSAPPVGPGGGMVAVANSASAKATMVSVLLAPGG